MNPLTITSGLLVWAVLEAQDIALTGAPLLLSLLFAVGLPGGRVLWLKRIGAIDRLFVLDSGSRIGPLQFAAISCLSGWLGLSLLGSSPLGRGLMLSCASNAALAAVYNRWWRLSLHSVGAWGAQAAILTVAGSEGLMLLPLAVLVSWSRVILKEHTVRQVLAGGIVGASSTWLVLINVLVVTSI